MGKIACYVVIGWILLDMGPKCNAPEVGPYECVDECSPEDPVCRDYGDYDITNIYHCENRDFDGCLELRIEECPPMSACRNGECGTFEVGEECPGGYCVTGAECVGVPGLGNRCMEGCLESDGFCAGGEICMSISGGLPVCYPGGPMGENVPCSTDAECGLTMLCLKGTGAEPCCARACDTVDGDPGCGETETCMDLVDRERMGYCARSD